MAVARRGTIDDGRTRARTIGVVTLAALNVLDLITTRAAMAAGADEVNPLADFLLQGGWLDVAKISLSLGLLYLVTRPVRRPPTRVVVAAIWVVVAVYGAVVTWNFSHLVRLSGGW